MARNGEDNSPERCIDYANELIELCELQFPRISSIQDINSSYFVSLFERITGVTVPDLFLSEDSTTDAHNIQAMIDTLSLDLLGLCLSHIKGEDIVSGNVISILNLLEILEAVYVHLSSEIRQTDVPTTEENYKSPSTDEQNMETVTLEKSLEDNEIEPCTKTLERKICKNTLGKSHELIPKKKAKRTVPIPSHTKREADTYGNLNSLLKRKNPRPIKTVDKRLNVEGLEDLHEANLEKRIKELLQSDKSPVIRAQEMRRKYIQSLKLPLKKTSIPPCKKSFLLPHNLQFKSKPPVCQHHTRKKTSSMKQRMKYQLQDNIKSNALGEETPVAIQSMLKEFPGFQFPKNTLELLRQHYYQHVSSIHTQLKNVLLKKPKTVKQTEEALQEEAKLSKILTKDLKEKDCLRKVNEHKALENRIKISLRDARMQSVKMRQYFEEFHRSMSRRLAKRNFSEEVLIEKTFKEMLDLQREKVRLLCKRVKEADYFDAVQHRKYLDALKNLYQEQLSLLAESVNVEKKESFEREKAERLATDKVNQEILKTLQKEVRSLQKDVLDMLEDIHFRELDAENFIKDCWLQDSYQQY